MINYPIKSVIKTIIIIQSNLYRNIIFSVIQRPSLPVGMEDVFQ